MGRVVTRVALVALRPAVLDLIEVRTEEDLGDREDQEDQEDQARMADMVVLVVVLMVVLVVLDRYVLDFVASSGILTDDDIAASWVVSTSNLLLMDDGHVLGDMGG